MSLKLKETVRCPGFYSAYMLKKPSQVDGYRWKTGDSRIRGRGFVIQLSKHRA